MKVKFGYILYLSKCENRLKLGITAVFLYSILTVSVQAFNTETVEDKYPGLSTGVLKSAKLAEMIPGILLSADGFEVPYSWVKETLNGFPAEMRKQIEGSLFFLLEQDVTQKAIVRDAKIAGIPTDGRTEDQIIQSYLTEKVARITVSDEETKAFYDDNKELVGGLPFDQ